MAKWKVSQGAEAVPLLSQDDIWRETENDHFVTGSSARFGSFGIFRIIGIFGIFGIIFFSQDSAA